MICPLYAAPCSAVPALSSPLTFVQSTNAVNVVLVSSQLVSSSCHYQTLLCYVHWLGRLVSFLWQRRIFWSHFHAGRSFLNSTHQIESKQENILIKPPKHWKMRHGHDRRWKSLTPDCHSPGRARYNVSIARRRAGGDQGVWWHQSVSPQTYSFKQTFAGGFKTLC